MRLSAIIPAYNEEKYLPALIASLRAQNRPPFEIVVVDNESTDNTSAVARNLACKVVTVSKKGFSVSLARNVGAKNSSGEIFCFIDADCVLIDLSTLKKIATHIQRGAVGGFFKSTPPEKTIRGEFLWPIINFFKHFIYASSGLIYCTQEAYLKSGGFDESREIGEDLAFTKALKRLGRFKYDSTVVVHLSDRRMLKEGYLKVMWKWFIGASKSGSEIEYHPAR